MADSPMEKNGIGNISEISFPYTATSDGFVHISLNNDPGKVAAYHLQIGTRFLYTTAPASSMSNSAPVKCGETISHLYHENVATCAVYFIPLKT